MSEKQESDEKFLRNLAETLRNIPVQYGTDDYDISRLQEIATKLEINLTWATRWRLMHRSVLRWMDVLFRKSEELLTLRRLVLSFQWPSTGTECKHVSYPHEVWKELMRLSSNHEQNQTQENHPSKAGSP